MATPAFNPNASYEVAPAAFDPNASYETVQQHDWSSLTHNPKGEGVYQVKTPDGQTVGVPYSNVPVFQGLRGTSFATPDEQARFEKDANADPHRPTFWNALTNPVGSGGVDQGAAGGALQVGGQAIKAMVQPLAHPLDTLAGLGRVASDAVTQGPQAAGREVIAPMVQQYLDDKARGGSALAAENLAGQVAGNVEGGRVLATPVSGIERSAALGAAGEAPVAGAAGPVNAVSGMNRLIPEAVRSGILPSGWDWGVNAVKPALAGDVHAPIPGNEAGLTPLSRYASMRAMGLNPNAAEATNAPLLKGAEDVNQDSLFPAGTYARARAANLAALNRFTTRALDAMSPVSAEEGGAAIQQALLKSHADLKTAATEVYKDLDAQSGDQILPGSADLREQAQTILDANAPYYKLHPELEPTKAMAIVRDLAQAKGPAKAAPAVIPGFGPAPPAPDAPLPRGLTFSELHRLRSDLLDFNNTNPDLVKNQANGWISQLAGAADNAITSGEGSLSPSQVAAFRDANEAWKYMKSTYDNPSHPFYQAVRTIAPSGLPATLSQGLSRTPEITGQLQAALGDEGMGAIQRAVAEKALGTTKEGAYNFRNFQGMWNKLPEQYREALFTPEQRGDLQDIGNAGTVLHEDANPSGSAKLGQRMAEMGEASGAIPAALTGHPGVAAFTGGYHAGQYALGKLMNSPRFVDWLMRDAAPAAAAAHGTPISGRLMPAAVTSGAMASGWDWQNNKPRDE